MEVFGTIFYKAGKLPVIIGGGQDNPYTNNIFIGGDFAVHIDNRMQGWSKATLDKYGIFNKRLKAVNYKNPLYSSTCPELINYRDDDLSLPKRNTFSKNIFNGVQNAPRGKAEWLPFLDDNWITNENPGFVNEEELNFNLKEHAKAFEKIPGFKAIPFEKIGIQNRHK